jgi:predicted kinase
MRKWMRERMKRRKKSEDAQPAEQTQAPLQPAYFEPHDAAPSAEPVREAEPEAATGTEAEPGAETPESNEVRPQTASETSTPRRRRRGRGGRRGGGKSKRAAEVPAPVAVRPAPTMESEEPSMASAPLPESPAAPIEIPAAQPRRPKGSVILAIGLPGSGKSSWFKRNNITPLSSDMLRILLFDNAQEQRFQDLVFSNLRSMLKARLIARRPLNYVDATNLTPHERHSWIKLAKDYGYDVQAVFFDVPVEVCMERNRRRERVVDEDVMRRMAAKLKPPTFEEGFSKVTVVRVKKKEAEAS